MIEGKDYEMVDGHLRIFDGVKVIPVCAFAQKSLTSVYIPNSVIRIEENAFCKNKLTEVTIPNSVIEIEKDAFWDNELTSIIIPNSVTSIGMLAFFDNKLENISIPNSVTRVGKAAFDDNVNVTYNDVLIPRNIVKKYGYQNIIKIYELQKIIPLDQIYNIPKFVLEVIPVTSDAVKGYILNRKIFENLNDFIYEDEYKDFFKLCFTLGLFNKSDEDVIKFIKQIKEERTKDYIHQMWTAVKLSTYKPKFKSLFMKLYSEGKTDYEGQNIIGRLYSAFEKINKYTLKRHEEEISKKNTEIKRLKELGANTSFLERELEKLKKNKKNVEYEDITYYIKNNNFDIREGNEDLKDVASILSIHMEQDGFDMIQDVYEKSLDVEKIIPLTNDTSDKYIKYHWSKSDNPVNTILGYIVDCCAKLGGAAEDIMIQSMINPDVANLIIYDENNHIIGKATAYYNKSKKYILFNNVETKQIGTKGLKSAKQRQKECLEALIRGVMDVTRALKEKGEVISEVRIGMLRNDLKSAINDYGLKITSDLLESYPWKNYDGDASDREKGQAIIYKDDDIIKKEGVVNHG